MVVAIIKLVALCLPKFPIRTGFGERGRPPVPSRLGLFTSSVSPSSGASYTALDSDPCRREPWNTSVKLLF